MTRVPYVPGYPARSVTGNGQKDVTRQYRCPDPRAGTHRRSRRVTKARLDTHGIPAVITALALTLAADGGLLMLIAWWSR